MNSNALLKRCLVLAMAFSLSACFKSNNDKKTTADFAASLATDPSLALLDHAGGTSFKASDFSGTNFSNGIKYASKAAEAAGRTLGTTRVENGVLKVTHDPAISYHSVWADQDYEIDLSKTTWIHFRFKWSAVMHGADMYTTIQFPNADELKNGFPSGTVAASTFSVGINSEQHWKQNYFSGIPALSDMDAACQAKTLDDEFFISATADLIKAPDERLAYPVGYQSKYTDWTTFSLRYDPPGAASTHVGKFSIFVDGLEVGYHPLDAGVDANGQPVLLDMSSQFVPLKQTNGLTKIRVAYSIISDGDEEGAVANKFGIRGRGCYVSQGPSLPTAIVYPDKFDPARTSPPYQFSESAKAQWMRDFDDVEVIAQKVISDDFSGGFPTYPRTRESNNTLDIVGLPVERFYRAYNQELNPNSELYYVPTSPASAAAQAGLRPHLDSVLRTAIYNGQAKLRYAVLMGFMALPEDSDPIWATVDPDTNNQARVMAEVKAGLNWMATNLTDPEMAQLKKFTWYTLYNVGGIPDLVHFGYLLPEEVRANVNANYMSSDEWATIPQSPTPVTAEFQWEYLRIGHDGPSFQESYPATALVNTLTEVTGAGATDHPAPVVMLSAAGGVAADVFNLAPDGGIWHQTLKTDGTRAYEEVASGKFTSVPAVVSWYPGRFDVFARGTDCAIWHSTVVQGASSSWSTWESLGGCVTSAPAATSWGAGRTDVVALAADNAIWITSFTGTNWNGWTSLGGSLSSAPSITTFQAGNLEIFAKGMDSTLSHWAFRNYALGSWESLGGSINSPPSVMASSAGNLVVALRGWDAHLWAVTSRGYAGNWNWTQLDGTPASGPRIASVPGGGILQVAAIGADETPFQLNYVDIKQ